LGLVACGYRFTAGGAPLPDGIRRVYIPVFANHTSEAHAEAVFTELMREEAQRAGTAGDRSSDARLEGDLRGLSSGTGMTLNNAPSAPPVYRLAATIRLKLVRTGSVLGQVDVDGTEDYLSAGGDILATEANRQAALSRLARTLCHDGYNRLASGF
jgi:hypothetical protein